MHVLALNIDLNRHSITLSILPPLHISLEFHVSSTCESLVTRGAFERVFALL